MVHTGDMISINSLYNNRKDIPAMWQLFNRRVRDRFTSKGIAFFPSPGNHDVYGLGREYYRENWKNYSNRGFSLESGSYAGYYAFHYKDCHFIVLDGSGISLPKDQVAWLNQALALPYGRNFVFSHVGLTGSERHPGDYLRGEIGQVLERFRVPFFISGHQHKASVEKKNIITCLSAGSAGETEPYNFLLITVSDEKVGWKILKGADCR